MGKRRKGSNKKRDAALAGLKDAVSDDEGGAIGEEGIYGEVDQWEKGEDARILNKVKFRGGRKEEDGNKEVFALSGTDSDSDLELPDMKKLKKKQLSKQTEDDELHDSDIASDDDRNDEEDVRRWGTKKKHYYGGNTGEEIEDDLEESDLEEDKMEEIEAAKLQSRQLEMMEEEDFLDTFVPKKDDKKQESKSTPVDAITKDFSKLSAKEQSNLFRQQNPEFEGVVADFNIRMKEAVKLSKIVSLAEAGEIPDGPCLDFIKYKLELLLNYCTNISAYLMFKSKGCSLTLHPVTTRLVQYRQLIDKVESSNKTVMKEVDNIVDRLEGGDSIKTLVREERRRVRRDLEKKNVKKSKSSKPQSDEKKKKKKTKKKPDESVPEEQELTRDERMALEVYDAIKKNKTGKTENSEGESEEEEFEKEEEGDDDAEDETNNVSNDAVANTYNNENEDLEDDDIDEKRAITYKIAKNKGLTPKRSKLQRNPRVKNRMKYSKALKRRKGAVRDIRDQNIKYGGEASGINMRVKKGVKFS